MFFLSKNEKERNFLQEFQLFQNYPNPFNPVTTIKYNVPEKARVSIAVYNTLGQKIKTLVDKNITVGNYKVTWNGQDDFGNKVSSGVYFYHMSTKKGVQHE
jgi:flagellar hook assembly protein FlgD